MTPQGTPVRARLLASLVGLALVFALSGKAEAGGSYRHHDRGHVAGYYADGIFGLFFGYPYGPKRHHYYAPRHRQHVYRGHPHRYKHHYRKHHYRKHYDRRHHHGRRHGWHRGHRRHGHRH